MGPEITATDQPAAQGVRLAVVAEAFVDRPLSDLLDWLLKTIPEVTAVELGTGGYAPNPHCNPRALLADAPSRRAFAAELARRGFAIAALNAWGNPLHPDGEVASRHDRDLRDSIRLAAELGVERVVALAGCPAAVPGDRQAHFAAGGWLPYLEDIYDAQWQSALAPYWSAISEFAEAQSAGLRICIELHPGTAVYNVETFLRLRSLGENLCATIDPSHFFWQQMDTEAVIAALQPFIGHVHAKDVVFDEQRLATDGLLDHRWRGSSLEGPWRFAAVGEGHGPGWWSNFVGWFDGAPIAAIAIEHEDLAMPAEMGVARAAQVLATALGPTEHADAAISHSR
jgi:sugar phosphate isomerase/epimerase